MFKECNRTCKGCCNKDWDLDALPKCTNYQGYDEIILTGGEPMLNPDLIIETIQDISIVDVKVPIYLYTAKCDNIADMEKVLRSINGITLTLHTRKDLIAFKIFNDWILSYPFKRSFRLNVFNGISLDGIDVSKWKVKSGIKWIKDCPLPTDEVFMRL